MWIVIDLTLDHCCRFRSFGFSGWLVDELNGVCDYDSFGFDLMGCFWYEV